jgi:hypothetical protein
MTAMRKLAARCVRSQPVALTGAEGMPDSRSSEQFSFLAS